MRKRIHYVKISIIKGRLSDKISINIKIKLNTHLILKATDSYPDTIYYKIAFQTFIRCLMSIKHKKSQSFVLLFKTKKNNINKLFFHLVTIAIHKHKELLLVELYILWCVSFILVFNFFVSSSADLYLLFFCFLDFVSFFIYKKK